MGSDSEDVYQKYNVFCPFKDCGKKKHPCSDCGFCQWCSDERCEKCRKEKTGKICTSDSEPPPLPLTLIKPKDPAK